MNYFIMFDGQVIGPMSKEQLIAYGVNPQTQVCEGKDGQWRPLYTYPELMELCNGQASACATSEADSKRVVCGVLAILVGGLGLQYFLIGKTAAGLINIALSLCTCGLWSLVNFVQGIMILCMSDADWRRKFVDSTSTFPVF